MNGIFTLVLFFPETQDNRAAAIWNFAGNCDKEDVGNCALALSVYIQKDISTFSLTFLQFLKNIYLFGCSGS